MTFARKITLINIFVFFLFLADRVTKFFAQDLPLGGFFLFPKKILGLQFYKNYYLIFNLKINYLIICLLVACVLIIVVLVLIKNYGSKNIFFIFSLSLIAIGALSNFIDRLYFGYVVDFLSFFDYSIFNLADVYIFVGIVLILLKLLSESTKSKIPSSK